MALLPSELINIFLSYSHYSLVMQAFRCCIRQKNCCSDSGFTLIELSIVLVIIGLIVGGVLVGRDLIKAAEVRATVTQVEKYNQAVNTFKGKYGYLPGDIPNPYAGQFGFATRGPLTGQGDGDGVLIGNWNANANPHWITGGEPAMVWVDLSLAHLIEGNFTTASPTVIQATNYSGSGIDLWFPRAKIGSGNYFIAQSGDGVTGGVDAAFMSGQNYLSLVDATSIVANDPHVVSYSGLTVSQAYAIDTKMDDGMPQTGRVLAGGMNNGSSTFWAAGGTNGGTTPGLAATGSSTTCFDNGGNAANKMAYSITQNNGAGTNCALSFQFQ